MKKGNMFLSGLMIILGAIVVFIFLALPPYFTDIQRLFVMMIGLVLVAGGIAEAFE